jgi:osmotically-inducible protein OsmY
MKKIFGPLLTAPLAVLPFVVGCQTMDSSSTGSSTTVVVPTVESSQDQALSKAVRARLLADKKLDLTGITVASTGGTVYLSGVVKSLDARQQAIKIAWDVPGVQSVVNSLDVQK